VRFGYCNSSWYKTANGGALCLSNSAWLAVTSRRESFAIFSAKCRITVDDLASLEVATRVAEFRSNALEISAFRSIAVLVARSMEASRMSLKQAS
jgi:hypothetical protein